MHVFQVNPDGLQAVGCQGQGQAGVLTSTDTLIAGRTEGRVMRQSSRQARFSLSAGNAQDSLGSVKGALVHCQCRCCGHKFITTVSNTRFKCSLLRHSKLAIKRSLPWRSSSHPVPECFLLNSHLVSAQLALSVLPHLCPSNPLVSGRSRISLVSVYTCRHLITPLAWRQAQLG